MPGQSQPGLIKNGTRSFNGEQKCLQTVQSVGDLVAGFIDAVNAEGAPPVARSVPSRHPRECDDVTLDRPDHPPDALAPQPCAERPQGRAQALRPARGDPAARVSTSSTAITVWVCASSCSDSSCERSMVNVVKGEMPTWPSSGETGMWRW